MAKDFRDTKKNRKIMKRIQQRQRKPKMSRFGLDHGKLCVRVEGDKQPNRHGAVRVIYSAELGTNGLDVWTHAN